MRDDPKSQHRRSIRLKGYDYARAGAYFVTICTQGRAWLFGDIVHDEMALNDAGHMIQRMWDAMPTHYAGIETDAFIIMPNHIHGIIVIADPSDIAAATVGAGPRACPDTGPRACPDTGPRACPDYDGHVDYPNDLQRVTGQPITGQPITGQPITGQPIIGQPIIGQPTIGQPTIGQPQGGQPQGGQPQGVAPTGVVVPMGNGGVRTGLSLPDVVHRFKSMTTHQYILGVKQSGWPPFPGKLWQRNYWEHIVRNEQDLTRLRAYIRYNPKKWALDELMAVH